MPVFLSSSHTSVGGKNCFFSISSYLFKTRIDKISEADCQKDAKKRWLCYSCEKLDTIAKRNISSRVWLFFLDVLRDCVSQGPHRDIHQGISVMQLLQNTSFLCFLLLCKKGFLEVKVKRVHEYCTRKTIMDLKGKKKSTVTTRVDWCHGMWKRMMTLLEWMEVLLSWCRHSY